MNYNIWYIITLFGNDTNIFVELRTLYILEDKMLHDLNLIESLLNKNNLIPIINKTDYLLFHKLININCVKLF
jgi:hypothetical protein